MATKFSRKTFLKAGAAGLGMMALNVCTASAAAPPGCQLLGFPVQKAENAQDYLCGHCKRCSGTPRH